MKVIPGLRLKRDKGHREEEKWREWEVVSWLSWGGHPWALVIGRTGYNVKFSWTATPKEQGQRLLPQ